VFPIDDDTLPNYIKRKHPRKGEKKETRGLDQSSGKQTVQKRQQAKRKQGTTKY
jgi:hypothetical protein